MTAIPGNYEKIQTEETAFGSSIGERVFEKVGAIINKALSDFENLPVGSIEFSVLDEATFQAVRTDGWVLMDGRDISGSALSALTGIVILPDVRGRFLRGKDHGRGIDPNGDVPVGTIETEDLQTHGHAINITNIDGLTSNGALENFFTPDENNVALVGINSALQVSVSPTGVESRPRNVTVNFFIRIN